MKMTRFWLVALIFLLGCQPGDGSRTPEQGGTHTPAADIPLTAGSRTAGPSALPTRCRVDNQQARSEDHWYAYVNLRNGFSISAPPGWVFLETPNETYPDAGEQIWFDHAGFPPPNTGARPDVAIQILSRDPTPDWTPDRFDNYRAEVVPLGNVQGLRISGNHKESNGPEDAMIVPLGERYLLVLSNQSQESLAFFDVMLTTLRALPAVDPECAVQQVEVNLPTSTPRPAPTLTAPPTPTPVLLLFPSSTPSPETIPLTPTLACETHSAEVLLSATATRLKVGEAVVVTVELKNTGCVGLGLPQYRLALLSSETEPVLSPEKPDAILRSTSVGVGDSDRVTYQLQGVRPGKATLNALVSFEVHLGYPGPAYWGSAASKALVIEVE